MTISRVRLEVEDPKDWPENGIVAVSGSLRAAFLTVRRINFESTEAMVHSTAEIFQALLVEANLCEISPRSVLVAVGTPFISHNRLQALKFERADFWSRFEQTMPLPLGERRSHISAKGGSSRWVGTVDFDYQQYPSAIGVTLKTTSLCIGSDSPDPILPKEVDAFLDAIPAAPVTSTELRWHFISMIGSSQFIAQSFGEFDDPESGVVVFGRPAFIGRLADAFTRLASTA